MATHSSILAWGISWTKEPGGLQSTGCTELDATEATHQASRHTGTAVASLQDPRLQSRG